MVDATNVQPESRKPLVALARQYHCLPVAIVLEPAGADLSGPKSPPRRIAISGRTSFGSSSRNFAAHSAGWSAKAFATCSCWSRPRRSTPRRSSACRSGTTSASEHGPFDIIGDVHGCCDELEELLERLGYLAVADRS